MLVVLISDYVVSRLIIVLLVSGISNFEGGLIVFIACFCLILVVLCWFVAFDCLGFSFRCLFVGWFV